MVGEVATLPEIRAFFLGGSYTRGSADACSDIDLIALVDPQHHADVVAWWRQILEKITHITFWNQQGQDAVLLNAITYEWLRCDLLIIAPAAFANRARNLVRPLVDPEGFSSSGCRAT